MTTKKLKKWARGTLGGRLADAQKCRKINPMYTIVPFVPLNILINLYRYTGYTRNGSRINPRIPRIRVYALKGKRVSKRTKYRSALCFLGVKAAHGLTHLFLRCPHD